MKRKRKNRYQYVDNIFTNNFILLIMKNKIEQIQCRSETAIISAENTIESCLELQMRKIYYYNIIVVFNYFIVK
ncbi:hypothetical protein SSYM_0572 [Serratia symbiotica str. Tucson]|uniref:Uncharacterized protein n=2 Tax=Serratia symbiotica TaxID=138074 RepID=E9CK43_9GAMM|nr:hypothetical protein SSYM_0572 [Serratia symbiotica str. Tucson]BBI91814.1 uncharacterized protein SSYIS1_12170 [Serratia symbiotica]